MKCMIHSRFLIRGCSTTVSPPRGRIEHDYWNYVFNMSFIDFLKLYFACAILNDPYLLQCINFNVTKFHSFIQNTEYDVN